MSDDNSYMVEYDNSIPDKAQMIVMSKAEYLRHLADTLDEHGIDYVMINLGVETFIQADTGDGREGPFVRSACVGFARQIVDVAVATMMDPNDVGFRIHYSKTVTYEETETMNQVLETSPVFSDVVDVFPGDTPEETSMGIELPDDLEA